MNEALDYLITATPRLWRGNSTVGSVSQALPTGFYTLDQILPDGGWPLGAMVELLVPATGIGELRLAAPALRAVTCTGRYAVLIAPPYLPFAPALEHARIDLQYLLLIKTKHSQQALWAADKALRNPACGLLLLWVDATTPGHVLRRLQMAAREGNTVLLLYRPEMPGGYGKSHWANIRLRLQSHSQGLALDLLKAPGQLQPQSLTLNFQDG
ncbi:MAG: translesion DNA synthesis-associated protein ImuA [Gammaproteobacteria bacterium]|nr:translesion DNA synthesis-associated protein ImuA [Gammaproteobacteria bacterium]